MNKKLKSMIIATLAGGLGMWVTAGLWHNLILPLLNNNIEAHHEGFGLMLIAYFILAILITYIYSLTYKGGKPIIEGIKIGVIIGILWVFPHGLTMAAAHDTSIVYEIKNALWHMIEQGIGGIIIATIIGKK
jgi:hypothetical protein